MAITRIQVPVSDETRASLQALADARTSSLAAISAELLEQTAPIAGEMAKALLMAKQAPSRAIRQMNETLERQLVEIDQIRLDLTPKATRKTKKTG